MALSTGNISLQDVVTEIGTTPDGNGEYTLFRSFAEAHTYGFDPTYRGIMNSLYNFKGYDHSIAESVVVSPATYDAPNQNAGSFTLTITSNTSWTVNTNEPTWISFDQASGSLNDTITASYADNPGTTAPARSGRVTVTGEDGALDSCLINQPGGTQ